MISQIRTRCGLHFSSQTLEKKLFGKRLKNYPGNIHVDLIHMEQEYIEYLASNPTVNHALEEIKQQTQYAPGMITLELLNTVITSSDQYRLFQEIYLKDYLKRLIFPSIEYWNLTMYICQVVYF
jgi:hypothetical protein